jgi:hypothetical protein
MQSTEVVEENDAGCSYKKNKLEDELKDAQRIAIDDCIDKEQNIRDLMKQIDDCDGVLEVNLNIYPSIFFNFNF